MNERVSNDIFALYFSAFSPHAIDYGETRYPTVEHAYHCLRFADPAIADEIRDAKSPARAWELSQKYKSVRRSLSDDEKLTLMETLMRAKLEQHEDVRLALHETGNKIIEKWIVAGPPGDSFWDIGDGQGLNHVGRIWMKLRGEIL